MPEITATVVAKSAYGIKIEQDGDWMNWSKDEFRGEPFNTEVQKGDRVQITYAESDTGKVFITTIDKVSVGIPAQAGQTLTDEFLPDEDFLPDEPQERSAPSEDYGQSLWAKDRLRARTDCIACAVGIFKSSIEMKLLAEMPTPEKVVAYAAVLELWAKSDGN